MTSPQALSIATTVHLSSGRSSANVVFVNLRLHIGYDMPILGLGVFQNYDCVPACLAALKDGYRFVRASYSGRNLHELTMWDEGT